MGAATSKHAWDEASTPAAHLRTRSYEADWRHSVPGRRPDPRTYLEGASPGETLALLRADLGLRWESGERVAVEWYRRQVPGLAEEALVALIYEEFCLREDHGESPDPSSFFGRFPEVASSLKRVLDIHDLVGSGHGTSSSFGPSPGSSPRVAFPEVGQTIAGFDLVEELGRGGFARVFRARERDLADRPVALKVARSGSREPQTLARLQHTHIVPVHSYRTDPATGLHLLCMPYFGRVTLAHLLADEEMSRARSGAQIVAALDRLDREESVVSSRPAGRRALAGRSYRRAVAWWGARLAEALQHAHERGVLHRDIKPSNVLVTGDGMPMLLDFNLAHEAPVDEMQGSPTLGGTVGYMSPEHLEALAEGRHDGVDARSDIYALGVVLYEALGERPFKAPTASRDVRDVLLRAAEDRRRRPPDLGRAFPETPPALAAVVAKCLAPDPADRYAAASDLATDLQAVADDKPLAFAREPIDQRVAGWLRRHRKALAVASLIAITLGASAFFYLGHRIDGERRHREIVELIHEAEDSVDRNEYDIGMDQYATAERLAGDASSLAALKRKAHIQKRSAEQARQERKNADHFLEGAELLRFRLIGFEGDPERKAVVRLDDALKPFYVLTHPNWTERDEMTRLNRDRRVDLIREVTELLFLQAWTCASTDKRSLQELAIARCDVAMAFVPGQQRAPWRALRAIASARLAGDPPARPRLPEPSSVHDAWNSYQWGRICLLADGNDPARAVEWLERATRLDQGQFWLEFDTAYQEDRAGNIDQALSHYTAALKRRPESTRALFNRGRLLARRGIYDRAAEDLDRALAVVEQDPLLLGSRPGSRREEIELERGLVLQSMGKLDEAGRAYQAVLDSPRAGDLRRGALTNLAKLQFDRGRIDESREDLERLLAERPDDLTARLARAILLLRMKRPAEAQTDLDFLLDRAPGDADALAYRARARMAGNRLDEALADAELALRTAPSPRHDRLKTRVLLALGRLEEARMDDPEEIRLYPGDYHRLRADLHAAASREDAQSRTPARRSTRAAILATLGDPDALIEAIGAVNDDPRSTRARLVLARVLLIRGDRATALREVDRAMQAEPDDPRLRLLRGRILIALGRPAEAVAELDLLERLGGFALLHGPRAEALMRLGSVKAALDDWNRAIAYDPDNPSGFLGRARAFVRLGKIDLAFADLETAASLASDRAEILAKVALAYGFLLPQRPDRAERVRSLTMQAWDALHLAP